MQSKKPGARRAFVSRCVVACVTLLGGAAAHADATLTVASPPGEYSKIEEAQAFALLLNGPATADSVERFAYCEFAGVGERVPVRIVGGPTRDAILKAVGLVPQQARALTLQCARPAAPEAKL